MPGVLARQVDWTGGFRPRGHLKRALRDAAKVVPEQAKSAWVHVGQAEFQPSRLVIVLTALVGVL